MVVVLRKMNEMTEMMKNELRGGWLGLPKPFKPIDLLGVGLGSYFIYSAVTNKAPPWLTISLGAIMIYIHSQRFFYAPQTKEGLQALLTQLNVTPQEITGTLQ